MATATFPTATKFTRFKYITDDDIVYVGEAKIEDDDVTFLSVWRYGLTVEEVFPYQNGFDPALRQALEICALEHRMMPPAYQIELPSDWDEIKVLDTETTYTAEVSALLPEVKDDLDAKRHGLRSVCRIIPLDGTKYRITIRGDFHTMRSELARVRLF